jgi:hypothetical protein
MKFKSQKHGESGTKLYLIWNNCRQRCYKENHKWFHSYGGRGIKMQENWITDYLSFKEYVTGLEGFSLKKLGLKGLTLDRINNNDDYKEGNLRWVSMGIQNRNKRKRKNCLCNKIGVSIDHNKYKAVISNGDGVIHLGLYLKEDNAAKAYQIALKIIQDNPNTTKEEIQHAVSDYRESIGLKRIKTRK